MGEEEVAVLEAEALVVEAEALTSCWEVRATTQPTTPFRNPQATYSLGSRAPSTPVTTVLSS
jgi:hypothetical protein